MRCHLKWVSLLASAAKFSASCQRKKGPKKLSKRNTVQTIHPKKSLKDPSSISKLAKLLTKKSKKEVIKPGLEPETFSEHILDVNET